MVVRVVVNGVGTIGKRVAHAVKLQDDMKLVGISDVAPTPILRTVLEPDGPLYKTDLYCSVPEMMKNLTDTGMYVKGTLPELLESGKVDVVVDATPAGIGAKNKPMYEKYGVKAIFQGGEKADVAEMTFNSFVNYNDAFGKQFIRVPSCNTTSLLRTLWALKQICEIEEVVVAITRRAVDPWETKKGPVNAIIPDMHVPSHHGPDVKTVMRDLNIKTLAVKAPTTLAHVHVVHVEVKNLPSVDQVKDTFNKTPRILLFKAEHGYKSTAEIIEHFRDILRPRYDMYEVAVWEETINTMEDDVFWAHAVHSEAIVIPENIDAIRAITGIEKNRWKSIKKTDESLGVK